MGVEAAARIVLVVEDEAIVRAAIVDEFRGFGWRVLEAASGEDAIALIADNYIDVVFTDIQLAGVMSGWDTAEALRARAPAVAVLYTSGNACDPARQVGGSLFIGKPYEPTFVIEVCHSLLDEPDCSAE